MPGVPVIYNSLVARAIHAERTGLPQRVKCIEFQMSRKTEVTGSRPSGLPPSGRFMVYALRRMKVGRV